MKLSEDLVTLLSKKDPTFDYQTEYHKIYIAIRCLFKGLDTHRIKAYAVKCKKLLGNAHPDELFAYYNGKAELKPFMMDKIAPDQYEQFYWPVKIGEKGSDITMLINVAFITVITSQNYDHKDLAKGYIIQCKGNLLTQLSNN